MEVVEAKQTDLESFFDYLKLQLSDNASDDSPLFLPIAKQHCHVSDQLRASFQNGFRFELGQSGWRKLWLAKDSNEMICGHIDLRHHNTDYSFHRVVLGMGVDQGDCPSSEKRLTHRHCSQYLPSGRLGVEII